MHIQATAAITSASALPLAAGTPSPGASFSDAIGAAMSQVETAQSSAKTTADAFLVGGSGDVHTVALAAQQAELSLEMFQQVRNKFVQAYQEIMKMPV